MQVVKIVNQFYNSEVTTGEIKLRAKQSIHQAIPLWIEKCRRAGIKISIVWYPPDHIFTSAVYYQGISNEMKLAIDSIKEV